MIEERQMFEMMLRQNISCIALYHNHVDSALKDFLKEIELDSEISKADKAYWKREYEVNFPEKLRETSFLLMFGHLEEMLFLLWRDKNPNSVEMDRGNGISKYKSYIKDILGTLDNTDYCHIVEAAKVRNSIIHIAGRVTLSTESEKLKKLAQNSIYYSIDMDRIKISVEGVSRLQKAISQLTRTLLNKSIQPTANASAD